MSECGREDGTWLPELVVQYTRSLDAALLCRAVMWLSLSSIDCQRRLLQIQLQRWTNSVFNSRTLQFKVVQM